ncbi:MAG: hypothetical protein F4Y67_04535 [Chloroflexi bacterium]|nr:hypothetical protein [Chloroflexota bacterium]
MAITVLASQVLLAACDAAEPAPAPSDVAADAAIKSSVTAVARTPTPAAAIKSTPTPEPEPEPHRYVISDLAAELVRETNQFHEAQITVVLENRGGVDGPLPILVSARLDDEEPQVVHTIERATVGDPSEIVFARRLIPGPHNLELSVGDSRESIAIEVASADLGIQITGIELVGPGRDRLPVLVTNSGSAKAENVRLVGNWGPPPQHYNGINFIRAWLPELDPGASQIVYAPVAVPAGEFDFHLSVVSNTLERDPSDNTAEARIPIVHDRLLLDVPAPRISYQDGEPVAHFRFNVGNTGEDESGRVIAGLAKSRSIGQLERFPSALAVLPRCQAGLEEGCWWGADELELAPGASRIVSFSVPLAAGEHALIAFVGGPDYGYRLGQDYFKELRINVPSQPATQLSAAVNPTVRGYWSDGTATVNVGAIISNLGSEPHTDLLNAVLSCRRQSDGQPVCESESTASLADGFGPERFDSLIRVPVGVPLNINLEIEGWGRSAVVFTVPEKILGVERYVWDCYRARRGSNLPASPYPNGCGGWDIAEVHKWPVGQPVAVWSTGRPEYVAVFDEVMARYSPIVNLDFKSVSSPEQADIVAYLGFPQSQAAEFGLQACEHFGGCVLANTNLRTGEALKATIAAWHFEWLAAPEQFINTIAHEVLHAIVAVGHRPTPDALMGEPVSPGDLEMIRLNSHPLIKPGMTMAQVRELIVLADELLDPVPQGTYGLLWRVAEGFQRAGSAEFEISGDWSGTCRHRSFGPASYAVTGYSHADARVARFESGPYVIWNLGDRYWELHRDEEFVRSLDGVLRTTGWQDALSDPLSLLHAAVAYGERDTFSIARADDSEIVFYAAEIPVPEGWSPISGFTLTTDAVTLRLLSFQMTRALDDSCQLQLNATVTNYGQQLQIPAAIAGL